MVKSIEIASNPQRSTRGTGVSRRERCPNVYMGRSPKSLFGISPVFARRLSIVCCLTVGCILSSACVLGEVPAETIIGNYAFSRGDYQESTVHYLNALQHGDELQPWVAYNLGNVYHSLGEVEAAHRMWDTASRSNDVQLLFLVHFNRGIALYESGRFEDAYKAFREALIINPANTETKVNLEMAQKKLQAAAGNIPRETVSPGVERTPEDVTRLLEYVRRKEGGQWVPSAHAETQTSQNDW